VLRFAVRDEVRPQIPDVAHDAASITGGWSPVPGRLDLHAPRTRPTREHKVAELIRVNALAWQHDLDAGAGRPNQLPARFRTTLLVDGWCWFGHRVRLTRIELAAVAETVTFHGGWPAGVDGAAVAADKVTARRGYSPCTGSCSPAAGPTRRCGRASAPRKVPRRHGGREATLPAVRAGCGSIAGTTPHRA
jgi:hypothetical protein